MFLKLFLFITVAFGLYAYYIWARKSYSRYRFAFFAMSAISFGIPTAFLLLLQSNTISYLLSIFTESQGLDEVKIGVSEFFVFCGIVVVEGFAYKFSVNAFNNWDGVKTRLDLQYRDKKVKPSFLQGAFNFGTLYVKDWSDEEIDSRIIDLKIDVAERPESLSWEDLSFEFLKTYDNEVIFSENGWIDEIKGWHGKYIAIDAEGVSKNIYALPVLDVPNEEYIDGIINIVIKRNEDLTNVQKVIFCVENCDHTYSNYLDVKGISVEILSGRETFFRSNNLNRYCDSLIKRFSKRDTLGTGKTLSDVFVDPQYIEDEDNTRKSLFSEIEKFIESNNREHLSIVGDYGQGKSTALLAYCDKWAQDWISGNRGIKRIPLLIVLRGRDPSSLSPEEFLAAWGVTFKLDGETLMNLIKSGQALLIFEGFDETIKSGQASQRASQFNALWQFAYPNNKIIFTGRPNFFVGEPEMENLLRLGGPSSSGDAVSRPVKLAYFNKQQVTEALRSFDSEVQSEIIYRFDHVEWFREIASRPSLLPLIAINWKNLQYSSDDLKEITSGEIIEDFIDSELNRKIGEGRDAVRYNRVKEDRNYLQMPKRIKKFYLQGVARSMQLSTTPNIINKVRFQKSIDRITDVALTYFGAKSDDNLETEYIKRIRILLQEQDRELVIESIASELRTSAILTFDSSGRTESYTFAHMQFYELLIAKHALTGLLSQTQQFYAVEKALGRYNSTAYSVIDNEQNAQYFLADTIPVKFFEYIFTASRVDRVVIFINYWRISYLNKFLVLLGLKAVDVFPEWLIDKDIDHDPYARISKIIFRYFNPAVFLFSVYKTYDSEKLLEISLFFSAIITFLIWIFMSGLIIAIKKTSLMNYRSEISKYYRIAKRKFGKNIAKEKTLFAMSKIWRT